MAANPPEGYSFVHDKLEKTESKVREPDWNAEVRGLLNQARSIGFPAFVCK
jgi:hypothetical protein